MSIWKRILSVIGVFAVIGTVLEYLALPALFVVVGLLNDFGWQYYAWTIGGYLVLVALAELIGALIGKMLGRAFELRLLRKLSRSKPTEENLR